MCCVRQLVVVELCDRARGIVGKEKWGPIDTRNVALGFGVTVRPSIQTNVRTYVRSSLHLSQCEMSNSRCGQLALANNKLKAGEKLIILIGIGFYGFLKLKF